MRGGQNHAVGAAKQYGQAVCGHNCADHACLTEHDGIGLRRLLRVINVAVGRKHVRAVGLIEPQRWVWDMGLNDGAVLRDMKGMVTDVCGGVEAAVAVCVGVNALTHAAAAGGHEGVYVAGCMPVGLNKLGHSLKFSNASIGISDSGSGKSSTPIFEAKEMLAYRHSGFSVDTSVCIAAHDRAGLERLLRYCARPPFAMERLRTAGSELIYRCAKQHSEPGTDKRGGKVDEITLTPLELIDRIAALLPPPRTHRHRYFGVLAPNSPLRAVVTVMAQSISVQAPPPAQVQAEPANTGAGEGAPGLGNPLPTQTEPVQPVQPKRPAHYLWAVLMARIYEVFPLVCPICGGPMRIIAFITHSADIRHILEHIGAKTKPPRITPARGPPLWDEAHGGR